MNRLISISILVAGVVLSGSVSAQSLATRVDSCPMAIGSESLAVYEGYQWFHASDLGAQGLSKIPNESFSVVSVDGEDMLIGAGRDATADDGSVVWYFTQAEIEEGRQFNVKTPNGDAYLVGSDSTLRVTLAQDSGVQVVDVVSEIECPGLLQLVYGGTDEIDKKGALLLAGLIGGGVALAAILDDDDDDDAPTPPDSTPAPPSSTSTPTPTPTPTSSRPAPSRLTRTPPPPSSARRVVVNPPRLASRSD